MGQVKEGDGQAGWAAFPPVTRCMRVHPGGRGGEGGLGGARGMEQTLEDDKRRRSFYTVCLQSGLEETAWVQDGFDSAARAASLRRLPGKQAWE